MPKSIKSPFRLDEALDAYRTQASSLKTSGPTKTIAYTAAASAALALAPSTDAAIQYTNPADIPQILPATGSANLTSVIDVNGDAQDDFSFVLNRQLDIQDSTAIRYQDMRVFAIDGGGFGVKKTPDLKNNVNRLSLDDTVSEPVADLATGRMRVFSSSVTASSTIPSLNIGGVWLGNTMNLAAAGFVGVAINNAGSTNYGWIRIGISNDATGAAVAFTVYDWAYETEPNTPITVGVIPEPSPAAGLALLAAGAAGVGAWRRRKNLPS